MSRKKLRRQNRFSSIPKRTGEPKRVLRFYKDKQKKDIDETKQDDIYDDFIIPIEEFLTELNKTRHIVMLLFDFTAKNLKDADDLINTIVENNKIDENEDYISFSLTKEEHKKFHKTYKKRSLLKNAPTKVLENFFISIFSQYENFLANQIRLIFKKFPGKLGSDKKLEYKDYTKFKSMEEIQEYFIENEIRGIIDEKTFDQIKKIESKLLDHKDNKILQDNINIIELVELSSRRNLYVHNEGKIHEQYISNLKEVGVDVEQLVGGERLKIDKEYFDKSFEVIYGCILIISYLVGRKIYHDNSDFLEKIDSYFNSNCIELINTDGTGSISLPLKLFEFVLNNKYKLKHNTQNKYIFIINHALCYKILGDEKRLNEILSQEDRKGCDPGFQFIVYVLYEKYDEAIKLMDLVSITKEQEEKDKENKIDRITFNEKSYHEFPVFYKFREEIIFLNKYKQIFGRDFNDESYYL